MSLIFIFRSLTRGIFSIAPDFGVLWTGAGDLIKGNNPYTNPNLFTGIGYPPNSLLFYLPFTLIPYQTAQGLFTILSFVSSIGIILVSFKILRGNFFWQTFLVAFSLTFFSFPTKFTLGMGQNNLIAFFLLILAYYFYKERKLESAGFILGMSIALKTIFVFFVLFFVLKKQWKIVIFTVLMMVTTVVITAFFFDSNLYIYYIKEVVPPLFNLSGREIYYNQGVMGFVSRLISDLNIRKYLNLIMSLFVITMVSWPAFYKKFDKDLQFSLFVNAILLIDTISWQHHFVWLIFPFIVLTTYTLRRKLYWALGLVFVSYLLVSWNFKNPSQFSEFPLSLLLSNTFYGTLLLFATNYILLLKTRR